MSVSVNDKMKGYNEACQLEKYLTKLDIIADDYTVNRISDKRMSEVLFTIEYGMKNLGINKLLNSERYVYDNKEVDALLKKYDIDKNNPREYTDEIRGRCYDEIFLKHFIEDTSQKLAVRKMQLGDGAYDINDTYAKDSEIVNSIELGNCKASEFLHVVRCKSQIENIAYMAEDFSVSLASEDEALEATHLLDSFMKSAGMKPVDAEAVSSIAYDRIDSVYESHNGTYTNVPDTYTSPGWTEVEEPLHSRCHMEAFLDEYTKAAEDSLNDYIYFRDDTKISVLENAYENAEVYYDAICKTGLEKAFAYDIIKASDLGVKRFSEDVMKYHPRQGTLRYKNKQANRSNPQLNHER